MTAALWIGLCGTSGLSLWLAIRGRRGRYARRLLEAENAMLHRRLRASEEALKALSEQVAETAPVYVEEQRRYGFDLSRWPAIQELVGCLSPEASRRWLLRHAPGIDRLSDGRVLLGHVRFFPEHNGWRPPRLPEHQQ